MVEYFAVWTAQLVNKSIVQLSTDHIAENQSSDIHIAERICHIQQQRNNNNNNKSMKALTISTMVTNHLLPNPSHSSRSRQKYLLPFSSEEYYEQGPSIPE